MGRTAVTVGVVGRPHGTRGEVTVRADPDLGEEFPPKDTYGIAGSERRLTVATSRAHAGRRLVRFEGITDRDAAEALRGAELTVPRDAVWLEPDEFWTDELVGRPVFDREGRRVGAVTDVTDGTAHDYLVVGLTSGHEALVPIVADLIEISEEAVVVEALPGLLDDPEGA